MTPDELDIINKYHLIPKHRFNIYSTYGTHIQVTYKKIWDIYGEPTIDFMSHSFLSYDKDISIARKNNPPEFIGPLGHLLNSVFVQWKIKNTNNEVIAVIYNELYNYYHHVHIINNQVILPTFYLNEDLEYDTENFYVDAIDETTYRNICTKLTS